MTTREIIATVERLETIVKTNIGNLTFNYREPQVDAIKASMEHDFGLFDMTCGLGKTLIQASIIYLNLEKAINEGRSFKCIWVCHRLMLERQVKSVFEYFFGFDFNRLNCKIVTLNSEGDKIGRAHV